MKKIIYIILIAVSSNLILSACTEEKIEPKSATASKIGGGSEDPM